VFGYEGNSNTLKVVETGGESCMYSVHVLHTCMKYLYVCFEITLMLTVFGNVVTGCPKLTSHCVLQIVAL